MNLRFSLPLALTLLASVHPFLHSQAVIQPQTALKNVGSFTCTNSSGQKTTLTTYSYNLDTNKASNPRYLSVSVDSSHFNSLANTEFFAPAPQYTSCVFSGQPYVTFANVSILDVAANAVGTTTQTTATAVITFSYALLELTFGKVTPAVPVQSPEQQAKALADFQARTK